MKTDVLSPRFLGPFLELYGLQKASYLAMYLCSFPLVMNHITGIDEDVVEACLDREPGMAEFDLSIELCMVDSTEGEIMLVSCPKWDEWLLLVKPGGDSSVYGWAAFGPEAFVHHFQDFLGLEMSRTSQRPSH